MHVLLRIRSLFVLFSWLALQEAGAQAVSESGAGRLFFTSVAAAPTALQEENTLKQFTLTNKSNLFLTVVLKRTLSSYLRDLAPLLSDDSLSKIGNYQFSFWVDNRLVYRTELLPGAPRPAQQQTELFWNKPLIDNQHEGAWWSQSAWNRFLVSGGDSALTEGPHLLKIILKPYIKTAVLLVGDTIAEGRLSLTVKRKPEVRLAAVRLTPVVPAPDLPVSREAFNRDTLKALKAYIEADVFRHITSVIILKKGKILFEEYFNGSGRDSLHDVRSVGKSFASTLTGMAIRDGYLTSAGQTLGSFYSLENYQNYSPAKGAVTLRELLTMTSRFNGDDGDPRSPGNEENMYPENDWVRFTLNLPLDTVAYHRQWHYFTAGVMLLGSVLNQSIPGGLEKYADTYLFKPLKINTYKWVYTPQGVPSTAGGIRMKALDFAKYGQLYASDGKWQDTQIVPEKWVRQSLSRQVPIPGRQGEYYGFLFWNKTFHSRGKAYDTYYCSGNGGNKIYILKDLVVVITATAYGSGYAHKQADQILEAFILPGIFGEK